MHCIWSGGAFAFLGILTGWFLHDVGGSQRTENAVEAKADNIRIVQEEEQSEEIPFVSIIEEESTELTLTWPGLAEDDTAATEEIKTEISEAIQAFSAEGYSTGFILYDLSSGGGISFQADKTFYSASAIKGPYVAWAALTYPESAYNMYPTISNTITWSSNEDYFALINTFGISGFNSWVSGLGCQNIAIADEWYPAVNARDFARLWISVYDSFLSGAVPDSIQNLYSGTLESSIYETLDSRYTVYSKAGWIGEGLGTYYNVQNDAGIVMEGDDPCVIVVLSDAYGRMDLLDNLVAALDSAHTSLLDIENTR